jgi:ferrous iron transport protein A
MEQLVTNSTFLSNIAIGERARITAILGGRMLHRKLLGLGIRVGCEVNVLHRRGRGVVVASAGNRIALGGNVADKLLIEPLPNLISN